MMSVDVEVAEGCNFLEYQLTEFQLSTSFLFTDEPNQRTFKTKAVQASINRCAVGQWANIGWANRCAVGQWANRCVRQSAPEPWPTAVGQWANIIPTMGQQPTANRWAAVANGPTVDWANRGQEIIANRRPTAASRHCDTEV
jgi:hypothetical protein